MIFLLCYNVIKKSERDGDLNMKFMSFNTQHCFNYVTRVIDFDVMAKAILDCDADIVGLNEMRDFGSDSEYTAQVEKLSQLTGMKYYYFAKAIDVRDKGPYGNGILSKVPLLSVETVMIHDPVKKEGCRYETRCILKAVIEGGVTVLVTHMGLHPDERVNAVAAVLEHVTASKCVLMGDFNMKPNDPTLHPIYDVMQDSAVMFDSDKLSYPSDFPKRKIDYIFVSRDADILMADIPAIVASDHRPHVAEVKFS